MNSHLTSPLLAALVFVVLALVGAAPPQPGQSADVAGIKLHDGKPDQGFLKRHDEFLERAKKGGIDLLFLGDSITEGWVWAPLSRDLWKDKFEQYNPANFGIGGDRTQHVLWRIDHGELDSIKPKVIVLLIGTNNVGSNPPAEVARGIGNIIKQSREKTGAKILLMAIFPRGEDPANDGTKYQRKWISDVNDDIKKFDDGKNVRHLDINEKLVQKDGKIAHEIMNDYLHLSPAGYKIWAESLEPVLADMMK